MTRKTTANKNLQAGLEIAQKLAAQKQGLKPNDAGIKGIFGDSLQKIANDKSLKQKQALFKLKHGKGQLQGLLGQKMNSSDNLQTAFEDYGADGHYMIRSPTHEMVFHLDTKKDEQVSAQKSLLDTASLGGLPAVEMDISLKKMHQESLLTSSSGKFAIHSNFGMTNKQAMYDGEIKGQRLPAVSSTNVASPPFGNEYGFQRPAHAMHMHELVTPSDSNEGPRQDSRGSSDITYEQHLNMHA